MFYKIHIVNDSQIAADWALIDDAGTFHLFVARSADIPQTYADAHMLMREKRQRVPQPRTGLLIGLPAPV